jgi:hypothetical protein
VRDVLERFGEQEPQVVRAEPPMRDVGMQGIEPA